MPDLIIVSFDSESGAQNAQARLAQLPRRQREEIGDAVAIAGAEIADLRLPAERGRLARIRALPRRALAAAFSSAFLIVAWAAIATGMVGSALIRGAAQMDPRMAEQVWNKVGGAQSALFLVMRGAAPEGFLDTLAKLDSDLVCASISAEDADLLQRSIHARNA